MQLKPFVPQTEAYYISYPQTNVLEEREDGVVIISSIENDIDFMISTHTLAHAVTFEGLKQVYERAVLDYTSLTTIETMESNQPMLLEAEFTKDETHWLWWGIGNENQIVLLAVNSEQRLDDENYNLYRHIIENLEVNPNNSLELR